MNKVYTNATSQYKGYITFSANYHDSNGPLETHPGCKRVIILLNYFKAVWR